MDRLNTLRNVWHLGSNGDVYPILGAVEQSQAEHVADVMQELSFAGKLPPLFYMVVPIGSDTNWIERMKQNTYSQPPVDYMQVYNEAVSQGFQIQRRWR
jgi:hypothetical protein